MMKCWIQISTAPTIDLAKASIGVRKPRPLRIGTARVLSVLKNPGAGILLLSRRCRWFADRTNRAVHGKLRHLPLETRRCEERPLQHAQGLDPPRQPGSRGLQGFRCNPRLPESKFSASPDQSRRADSDR